MSCDFRSRMLYDKLRQNSDCFIGKVSCLRGVEQQQKKSASLVKSTRTVITAEDNNSDNEY